MKLMKIEQYKTYRIVSERLLQSSAGTGPVKLLYPKSNTSNSFSSPIPSGIIPIAQNTAGKCKMIIIHIRT